MVAAAVALQDHLARSLKMGAPRVRPTAPRRRDDVLLDVSSSSGRLPPRARRENADPNASRAAAAAVGRDDGWRATRDAAAAKPWTNDEDDASATQAMPRRRRRPTLAERAGFVPAPPPPLTEAEWARAHATSKKRAEYPQCEASCAICLSAFGGASQVLLPCAHIFHERCFESFERFAGDSSASYHRCCPICRASAHEKRRIRDGAASWRRRAAIKIQTAWRRRRCVRWYARVRASIPPSDPIAKRAWFADKVRDVVREDVRAMRDVRRDAEKLFEAIAARKGEAYVAPSYLLDGSDSDEVAGDDDDGDGDDAQLYSDVQLSLAFEHAAREEAAEDAAAGDDGVDWAAVERTTSDRAQADCPICFAALRRSREEDDAGDGGDARHRVDTAPLALLDCSHCFHMKCLRAFEAYNSAVWRARTCPMCRGEYKRRAVA